VFVADGIDDTSTAIAEAKGDQYAFFRGTNYLSPESPGAGGNQQAGQQESKPAARKLKEQQRKQKGATGKKALL